MKETISNSLIWNKAAVTGVVFAAVTITCGLLAKGLAALQLNGFVSGLLSFLIWAAQFGGCIWLMIFFMKKLVAAYDGVTNSDTNRYGRRIALFSAILIAVVNFFILYFTPEAKMQEMIDEALGAYGSMLDSNSLAMMEEMLQNLPVLTFFGNLIYCFLYGTILSAILSRNIPAPDPFAQTGTSQEQQ